MTLNKKAIFPLVILIVSIIYFIEAIRLGPPVVDQGIRPSFVPLVLGALACLFSLVLTIKAMLARVDVNTEFAAAAADEAPSEHGQSVLPAVLTIITIAIYIALLTPLGYVVSSMIFVFGIIVIFSARDKWLSKIVTSAAIVAFGYIVFEQLFGVRLPTLWG